MKNNKGFTLVELLAVIVILLAVSSVVGWGITNTLERREVKECKEQVELAKGAAKIYFSINKSKTEVTIKTLKENDVISVRHKGRIYVNEIVRKTKSDRLAIKIGFIK